MKRRQLIAFVSLCTLIAIGILVSVGGIVVMRTDMARSFVQQRLAGAINGSVYVGKISGNPFSGLTFDSLAIRDVTGEYVVSTGRVTVGYDIRDLIDQRIYLRSVVAEHPHVHLRQFEDGSWNYKRLAKNQKKGLNPRGPARTWGDYVVVDSARIIDGSYFLSLPWQPDTSLRGAQRDSAIRSELARKDRKVRQTPDGYARTYMWTRANGLMARGRFADPDSNAFGQEVHVASLNALEFDPPFAFRNVRGRVRRLADSAWLNIAHFDLPGSTGSASGKVVWGSDRPMRYDVVVRGDSVTLADINWVYPTLPKAGSGRMVFRISNKRNDRVMDYHIDSMDVRSTRSRLVGEMTWGVGGPVLQLRNVNLRMDPLDFDLVRALNGKEFPIDWQGQIFGDVRAPGGPLNEFSVASARGEWRDTHVPGAVSRLSGSGDLDILEPAFTAFRGFDLDVQSLDLRSIQYLFPAFPKLNGTIAGAATLDSVWTDVRFGDADITHRDGPGTPSRFTGSGRITDGRPFITYDVDLNANPLSFDMLARSFPRLTLRGLAYGPVKIKGRSPDLQVVTNLVSAAGSLRFAGNIDIDSLGGFGARGSGEITNVNLAKLGIQPNAATTSLSGRYTLNVRGATPASLTGIADFRFGLSSYDRVRLDSLSRVSVRFERGRVITTDSLIINSPMGRIAASGALGLPGGGADSIAITLVVDSVGGLRPYFSADGVPAPADTLLGKVTVNGYATGRLDSLLVRGGFDGRDLFVRGLRVGRVSGEFTIADAMNSPSGRVNAYLADSVTIGGLRFDSVGVAIGIVDSMRGTYAVGGRNRGGDSLSMDALGAWTRAATATLVRLDTFALGFGESRWALDRPATLATDATTLRFDSLSLRSAAGGSIAFGGVVPVSGPIDLRLLAARVPLSDIDRVVGQVNAPLSGLADFDARVSGTRDQPVIEARTTLDSIAISDVRIGRLLGSARYADGLGAINADIFQGTKRVVHAAADSLPLAIRWLSYDTLPGRVRATASADSADFTLIQAFVAEVSRVTGKIFGNLTIDGTWARPNMLANASVTDGAMNIDTLGIALSKMYGSLTLRNDSLIVDTLSAQSGGERNTGAMKGTVVFKGWENSSFDMSMWMRDFQAYNRSELATIFARTDSGPIRLFGTLQSDSLTGVVNVDRGAIYLPDPKLVGKRFSVLDSLAFATGPRDTVLTLYQRVTANLGTDLRAHIGGSFKLSADYADIPLSGTLRIVPVASTDLANKSGDYISRLAPVGTINADRGTYILDLFPIKKSFDVQRGGTIFFDRDAQWNGLLNVSARYVVRKPGRPEVPIIVDVTDRLLTPKVRARSDASFQISESDLISYLVFDEPGFDLLGQVDRTRTGGGVVSSLFTPIATSFASQQLKDLFLGRWVDQFRFETANLDQSTAEGSGLERLFYASRLRGEKQLRENVYVSVSAGACGFKREFRENRDFGQQLYQQLGFNIDWRLQSSLQTGATWQLASEPSTQALLCSLSYQGSQGVVPTPRQYSLSFLKLWRW